MKLVLPSISAVPTPALKSIPISTHHVLGMLARCTSGNSELAWVRVIYCSLRSDLAFHDSFDKGLLRKPVSSPMEKQLALSLKEADKAAVFLELSIAGLVFIVATSFRLFPTPKVPLYSFRCVEKVDEGYILELTKPHP